MEWKFNIEYPTGGGTFNTPVDEPIGWADAELVLARDKKFHGIFFEYSLDLEFQGEAYNQIKMLHDSLGVEAGATLIIALHCDEQTMPEELYRGALNFTKVVFKEGDTCTVKIGLEKTGCLMTFNNRYDQEVDLDSLRSLDNAADSPDADVPDLTSYTNLGRTVTLPNKTILKHDEFRNTIDQQTSIAVGSGIPSGVLLSLFTGWQLGFGEEVLSEVGDIDPSHIWNVSNNIPILRTQINPLIVLQEDGTYKFDFNISLDFYLSTTVGDSQHYRVKVWFQIIDADDNTRYSNALYDSGAIPYLNNVEDACYPSYTIWHPIYLLSDLVTVNCKKGDKVLLWAEFDWDSFGGAALKCMTVNQHLTLAGNYFKVELQSTFPPTDAKVYLVNEALSRITESVTGDCMRVYSDYFGRTDAQPYASPSEGCGAMEVITNGLKIRNVPKQQDAGGNDMPQTSISMKKLFEGLNAIHNIGFGMETDPNRANHDLIRIEPIKYFYDNTVVLQLDKIAEVERRVLFEEHYSLFEFGYQKWEAEQFSGLDEFATKRKYRNTSKVIQKTLSQLSSLIASGYSIEVTRRFQYKDASTKDWRYDNDIFIICVKSDYTVEQGNIDTPQNLVDPPTVLNFRISPDRNILRWLKTLLQSYNIATDPTSQLFFVSSDGNYTAYGKINSGCVQEAAAMGESDTLQITTLDVPSDGIPLYHLEELKFDFALSLQQFKALKANPYQVISVRWAQQQSFVDCYIREIKYRPAIGDATFTLLPAVEYTCVDGIGCWIIGTDFLIPAAP